MIWSWSAPAPPACWLRRSRHLRAQAYWYVGLQQVALAFFLARDRGYALELMGKGRRLKQRFDRAFWMDDEGFYALALGPDKPNVTWAFVGSRPGKN